MTDDTGTDSADATIEETPEVVCSRCGRTWELAYELDDLQAGNRAVEQFAMDHHRHTGHFPDDVTAWRADCQHCPGDEEFLAERPARRWAETHARHTGHTVALTAPEGSETELVDGPRV